VKLQKVTTIELVPTSPFDFDSTFHKPDHFTSGDNYWEPGVRWQTWRWLGKPLGLKFLNTGTKDNPKIELEIWTENKLDETYLDSLITEVRYRYNLDLDLTDFYGEFQNHPILSPIIKKWQGMRPGHPSSLYEYLIIGVVLQNASVGRSIQMFKALLEKYGDLIEFDGKQLWCFWEPGRLAQVLEQELRDLKVGYRAKSIKKIDDYFIARSMNEIALRGKDLKFQMTELLKLYGVGPATVWYLLFDVFHHWDFFNHISPWEQKIYSKLFFDQDPDKPVSVKKLLKYINQFGKYKQLAVHYIWEDTWWQRKHEQVGWLEKLVKT